MAMAAATSVIPLIERDATDLWIVSTMPVSSHRAPVPCATMHTLYVPELKALYCVSA